MAEPIIYKDTPLGDYLEGNFKFDSAEHKGRGRLNQIGDSPPITRMQYMERLRTSDSISLHLIG